MNQNAPDDGAYDRPEDNMSLRDYEDKLKQNKGWLEMERIKQYNGDY